MRTTTRFSGFLLFGCLLLAAGRVSAAPPDKLLPAGTDIVVAVDLKALLNSEAVKKYALAEIRNGLQKNAGLVGMLKAVNFDPLQDLHSITLAIRNPEKPGGLAIVRGKFDLEKIQVLVDFIAASDMKKFGLSTHGKVKVYHFKEGDKPGFGAFLDKETVIFSQEKALVEGAIDRSRGQGKAPDHPELEAIAKKAAGTPTVSLTVAATEKVKDAIARNPDLGTVADKFQGATATLTVKDGIRLEAGVFIDDPATVQAIKGELDNQKQALLDGAEAVPAIGPVLVDILRNLTLQADGEALRLRGEVSGAVLEKLVKIGR